MKKNINRSTQAAAQLHENVPPDWYYSSIRRNPFQALWHKVRFSTVEKLVEKTDGQILDIGCADGMFTKVIAEKSGSEKVIGIDVLKKSVDWANKHWKKYKKMSFQVGNAHDLKFKNNIFSAVFALEVMEHVADPDIVIDEIYRVLKNGGYAIVLVPTDSLLFRIVWWFVTSFWWAKIWDDCHVQSFSTNNPLSKHMKKAGFKIEDDKRFWFGMLNVVKARKIK